MKLNTDQTVAVSQQVFWEPISSCPQGKTVQLLGEGGCPVYGKHMRGDGAVWQGWAHVPVRKDAE